MTSPVHVDDIDDPAVTASVSNRWRVFALLAVACLMTTVDLTIAVALPALPAAALGVPLGLAVYRVLDRGSALVTPPAWQLVAVVLATVGASRGLPLFRPG